MRAALFFILEPKAMATAVRSQEGLESSPQIARLVMAQTTEVSTSRRDVSRWYRDMKVSDVRW